MTIRIAYIQKSAQIRNEEHNEVLQSESPFHQHLDKQTDYCPRRPLCTLAVVTTNSKFSILTNFAWF